jgi:hypothetical protein
LGRMRGDPDVSRETSASHQSGSRRTPPDNFGDIL